MDLLQDPIEGDESSRAADTRAAMHHNGARLLLHFVAERPHEARERVRRVWHAEIWPRDEVEVSKYSFGFALGNSNRKSQLTLTVAELSLGTHSLHHKLRDDPIVIMAVVEERNFDVAVVDGGRVGRPVLVAAE